MAKRERITYSIREPKRVCGIQEPGTWVVEVRGPRNSANPASTNVYVNSWADGHGVWHAEFSTTDNTRRNAHVARVVIGHELACREGASAALWLKVGRELANGLPGVVRYREVEH